MYENDRFCLKLYSFTPHNEKGRQLLQDLDNLINDFETNKGRNSKGGSLQSSRYTREEGFDPIKRKIETITKSSDIIYRLRIHHQPFNREEHVFQQDCDSRFEVAEFRGLQVSDPRVDVFFC